LTASKEVIMIEKIFRRIWYDGENGPGLTCLLLSMMPFSMLYGLITGLRNNLFDLGFLKSVRLPARVVSIGNLTVGGTGKTPMVIRLARILRNQGYRPVVLSRGYGGKSKDPINVVSKGEKPLMNHREAGDEPVLIAKSLTGIPVLTGPRRVLTGGWALKNLDADVLILDDGFQHRQLFRDIDIVLLNAANPYGNGHLLPGGPLREPLSALKRADIIVTTGAYSDIIVPRPLILPDDTPIFKCYYQPRDLLQGSQEAVYPLGLIKGKKICAFAGIGNPTTFQKTLGSLGGEVAVFIPFPDHHRYTEADICLISENARQCQAEMIITTEKDKTKLDQFEVFLSSIYALRVEMEFLSGREDFERLLLEKLKEDHAG
jgi:tetraacyldisaccharide 4'-kinase